MRKRVVDITHKQLEKIQAEEDEKLKEIGLTIGDITRALIPHLKEDVLHDQEKLDEVLYEYSLVLTVLKNRMVANAGIPKNDESETCLKSIEEILGYDFEKYMEIKKQEEDR